MTGGLPIDGRGILNSSITVLPARRNSRCIERPLQPTDVHEADGRVSIQGQWKVFHGVPDVIEPRAVRRRQRSLFGDTFGVDDDVVSKVILHHLDDRAVRVEEERVPDSDVLDVERSRTEMHTVRVQRRHDSVEVRDLQPEMPKTASRIVLPPCARPATRQVPQFHHTGYEVEPCVPVCMLDDDSAKMTHIELERPLQVSHVKDDGGDGHGRTFHCCARIGRIVRRISID